MQRSNDDCKWLLSLKSARSQTALQLFCFPFAGGNSSTYFPWRKHLPDEVELIIVQPPGRGAHIGSPSICTMSDLIAELAPRIKQHIRKPFVFFGHSLGARVGFEIMNWLAIDSGFLPNHFIVSGSCAPDFIHSKSSMYTLPDEEFIQELVKLGGTPREVFDHPDVVSFFLPALRADFELAGKYAYQGSAIFDCPASIFGGISDYEIPVGKLEQWGRFFVNNPDFYMFEGNHFFIESDMLNVIKKVNDINLSIGSHSDGITKL